MPPMTVRFVQRYVYHGRRSREPSSRTLTTRNGREPFEPVKF
jgi:hypothetical protein